MSWPPNANKGGMFPSEGATPNYLRTTFKLKEHVCQWFTKIHFYCLIGTWCFDALLMFCIGTRPGFLTKGDHFLKLNGLHAKSPEKLGVSGSNLFKIKGAKGLVMIEYPNIAMQNHHSLLNTFINIYIYMSFKITTVKPSGFFIYQVAIWVHQRVSPWIMNGLVLRQKAKFLHIQAIQLFRMHIPKELTLFQGVPNSTTRVMSRWRQGGFGDVPMARTPSATAKLWWRNCDSLGFGVGELR